MTNDIMDKIKHDIENNDVVLYMKGDADFPQCGFSSVVVSILKKMNVKFKSINVLESLELREAIKEFTNWPTIPQLYVKGEFIGGCDIVKEMYHNGELQELLSKNNLIVAQ
ncbi:monothiol glutaredoxin, Grx4 family [Ehrlichia chaffeensis str. Heartland]|uniref:Glutaredoxin n=1 Tax=Ehrlichia chaffeensis (strain ATCC CRL-10679 / Arkansas) TaxID=205920 RepID=Q2GHG0_EHRCR|nr:Grx4 family monothiol glutaredoxin [Ehrlichia chaffeensis]ABD45365.1 glutaredoxin-related protein [Ehrlichia chaffeensis str. Arkansas]AHX03417.1 monothiol glutaredoxin, Grx4 family [Ehrlichia chaffeensis str. Heartland]AHX05862.1 monothiol glutaredoxin, Grx4 family [Ehrlichia chaffeensis str. Jax]AHX06853.1 monothiol glutaredoxin, Grx4 family [Ehrlichia chaffeensis str. Liberty]AHX07320.1 monothiol glutaredoxin, Grx4 family [Ehrlichia chaffeensis str. Osceola]